jgi:transposase InsO family protein
VGRDRGGPGAWGEGGRGPRSGEAGRGKKKAKQEIQLKIEELAQACRRVTKDWVDSLTRFSRSQLYCWRRGKQLERKERERKVVPEATVEKAAAVVARFPHFGGRKGQAYMLYHELGFIGMRAYDQIKRNVKRLFSQEVSRRKLLPGREYYEHVRAEKPGQIWAEDFTDVTVEGRAFKVAVLLDTYDSYYLGAAAESRATAALVGRPVEEALGKTGGKGPEKFLLSDNGSQYISEAHEQLLTSAEIVQRRIPACVPQYNGCVEGGMRELKSVFYNVWERRVREHADEEKSILERVEAALSETVRLMNDEIPRPSLGGVTPADVHTGNREAKRQQIQAYRARESSKCNVPPWSRDYWDVLSSAVAVAQMTGSELLTKLAFFCANPLRRIARRNREFVAGLPAPVPLRE